ncbi:MAG TPA: hypothetical protein VGA20_09255 [Gemmatimonadales bacterium]
MPDQLKPAALTLLLALAGVGPTAAQVPAYERSLRASAELTQLATQPVQPAAHVVDVIAQRRRARRDPGTVFLIVGGAVAVAGLLADEGLLVVGGVVVAGYGLYLNLR